MATRWQLAVVVLCTLLVIPPAHADIYRWDTGEVIPGTEGIEPGPGVQLPSWYTDDHNLRYADFSGGLNLRQANFMFSWLDYASFAGADLWGSNLMFATLTGADLSRAELARAYLAEADLTGANLSQAELTEAGFGGSDDGDNTRGANLTDADLTDATVAGARFFLVRGFTKEQLYSTADYKAKNLPRIDLNGNVLSGWDFSGQNLTNASLGWEADLTEADFSQADLTGANLGDRVYLPTVQSPLRGANLTDAVFTDAVVAGAILNGARGFTREQLYATTSYKAGDLQGIGLADLDLGEWNFAGQNLDGANFSGALLTSTNLSRTVLKQVRFGINDTESFCGAAKLTNADLSQANLTSASFSCAELINTDLRQANLTGARFGSSTCWNEEITSDNDLSGANLSGANLTDVLFESIIFSVDTTYNRWTVFPDGFDPIAAGLTLVSSPAGDFDANDVLDVADVDILAERVRLGYVDSNGYWADAMFDVNGDAAVDDQDHRIWVKDLTHTWFGDADLNGKFNNSDMVQVFNAGRYESGEQTSWSEGDWNGDLVFDSADMVTAFADGGYEKGPRTDAVAVPEPSMKTLAGLTVVCVLSFRWRFRQNPPLPWGSTHVSEAISDLCLGDYRVGQCRAGGVFRRRFWRRSVVD